MNLDILDASVTQVSFGFDLRIVFWPSAALTVEGTLELRSPAADLQFDTAEDAKEEPKPFVSLLGTQVESASVTESGELQILFSNGSELAVKPSPQYDSWDLTMEGSPSKVTCIAGGQVQIWD